MISFVCHCGNYFEFWLSVFCFPPPGVRQWNSQHWSSFHYPKTCSTGHLCPAAVPVCALCDCGWSGACCWWVSEHCTILGPLKLNEFIQHIYFLFKPLLLLPIRWCSTYVKQICCSHRGDPRDGDSNAEENLPLPLDGGLTYRHPVLPNSTVQTPLWAHQEWQVRMFLA